MKCRDSARSKKFRTQHPTYCAEVAKKWRETNKEQLLADRPARNEFYRLDRQANIERYRAQDTRYKAKKRAAASATKDAGMSLGM